MADRKGENETRGKAGQVTRRRGSIGKVKSKGTGSIRNAEGGAAIIRFLETGEISFFLPKLHWRRKRCM